MEPAHSVHSEREPVVASNVRNEIKLFPAFSFNCFLGAFVRIVVQEPLDLDDLLPALGGFGRYQKLLLWLICLPACIPCGFCAFNQLFMTDTPDDYWCAVPGLSETNLTTTQIKRLSIPVIEVFMYIHRHSCGMER